MRTCLESQYISKGQKKQIAATVVRNAIEFAQSANGTIVLTWLCDSSGLNGRYKVLSSKFKPMIAELATSKISNVFLGKICMFSIYVLIHDFIMN